MISRISASRNSPLLLASALLMGFLGGLLARLAPLPRWATPAVIRAHRFELLTSGQQTAGLWTSGRTHTRLQFFGVNRLPLVQLSASSHPDYRFPQYLSSHAGLRLNGPDGQTGLLLSLDDANSPELVMGREGSPGGILLLGHLTRGDSPPRPWWGLEVGHRQGVIFIGYDQDEDGGFLTISHIHKKDWTAP